MTSRGPSTRERILLGALDLMNREGEANVTSVDIANELDMSPGNLYYHFRGKEPIIEALFGTYESRMRKLLDAPIEAPLPVSDNWLYLYVLFEEIYAFRFLYRNLTDILHRMPALGKRFQRLLEHKHSAAVHLLDQLRRQELLTANDAEIEHLADLTVMLLTCWLDYVQLDGRHAAVDRRSAMEDAGVVIHQGVYRIMASIAPYLAYKTLADLNLDYEKFIEQRVRDRSDRR